MDTQVICATRKHPWLTSDITYMRTLSGYESTLPVLPDLCFSEHTHLSFAPSQSAAGQYSVRKNIIVHGNT